MYQGTELNFSEVPSRRGQISPGPIVVANGGDVTDLEARVEVLETTGGTGGGPSRAKGAFLYG